MRALGVRCWHAPRFQKKILEVRGVHLVPVVAAHLGDQLVSQDAGVVDHNVHAPKRVERRRHDLLAVEHGVVVGDRLTAGLSDGVDGRVGGRARFF